MFKLTSIFKNYSGKGYIALKNLVKIVEKYGLKCEMIASVNHSCLLYVKGADTLPNAEFGIVEIIQIEDYTIFSILNKYSNKLHDSLLKLDEYLQFRMEIRGSVQDDSILDILPVIDTTTALENTAVTVNAVTPLKRDTETKETNVNPNDVIKGFNVVDIQIKTYME